MKKNNTLPKIKGIKTVKITEKYDVYYIDGSMLNRTPCLMLNNPHGKEKSVYYIIENGNFVNGLYLHADANTNVTFNNCSFHEIVCINSYGNIEFSNNKYYADAEFPTLPKYFFNCICNSLKFKNDMVTNASYQTTLHFNVIGIQIKVNSLMFDETLVKFIEENSKIKINAKETILFDSNITADSIVIDSDNMYTVFSNINAKTLNIVNQNISEIENINADDFTYNGEKIEKDKVLSI